MPPARVKGKVGRHIVALLFMSGGDTLNIQGLIFLGAGYLLGNPPARERFTAALQQLAGQGIDALNRLGGEPNVEQPVEPKETQY